LTFGCSSINPLSVLTDKPSIEVNAQVAKNAEHSQSLISVESEGTKQTADSISNTTSTKADVINQITNELTWWQLVAIIICAGVAIPSSRELYGGVKLVITDTLNAFIIYPLKGISNFILKLFGR